MEFVSFILAFSAVHTIYCNVSHPQFWYVLQVIKEHLMKPSRRNFSMFWNNTVCPWISQNCPVYPHSHMQHKINFNHLQLKCDETKTLPLLCYSPSIFNSLINYLSPLKISRLLDITFWNKCLKLSQTFHICNLCLLSTMWTIPTCIQPSFSHQSSWLTRMNIGTAFRIRPVG
jgi:hypothetical protein